MRHAVLILSLIALGGCADQLAVRQAQLAPFVGGSEANLVQQMGVPTRTYEAQGMKFLAYDQGSVEVIPGYPYGPPYWGWSGGAFPPQVVNLVCETTFTVADGVVRSFVLRGNACG
jgi:hypothetical protein